MSSTLIFVGLPEDSKSSITKTLSISECRSAEYLNCYDLENLSSTTTSLARRGVPNAPKSCIAEIFSADSTDGSPVKNGTSRPRVVRDTPTRPRDTHSRLFGQSIKNGSVAPMVTDTIRSHIQFGDSEVKLNGSASPKMNGSASSTPSRGEPAAEHSSYSPPKRNPVTGDGVPMPQQRRRHPAASLREGNPITGDGYKSLNGQINTVTSIHGTNHIIHHSRVPPGGFSSGLW